MYLKDEGGSRRYDPHPKGPAVAKLIDVVDLGYQDTHYQGQSTGKKRKLRLVFVTNRTVQYEKDGQVHSRNGMISARFTASLHENSALRPFLTSWLGDDVSEIDLEDLIGRGAQINVTHTPKQDGSGVWDNIAAIMPVPEGYPLPDAPDYVRVKDRPETTQQQQPTTLKQQARQAAYQTPGPERFQGVPLPEDDPYMGAPDQDDLPF